MDAVSPEVAAHTAPGNDSIMTVSGKDFADDPVAAEKDTLDAANSEDSPPLDTAAPTDDSSVVDPTHVFTSNGIARESSKSAVDDKEAQTPKDAVDILKDSARADEAQHENEKLIDISKPDVAEDALPNTAVDDATSMPDTPPAATEIDQNIAKERKAPPAVEADRSPIVADHGTVTPGNEVDTGIMTSPSSESKTTPLPDKLESDKEGDREG